MRASWLLAVALVVGFGAAGRAQVGEVPADHRVAAVRRVVDFRLRQLNDSTGLSRCGLERLVGRENAEALAAEGLTSDQPDVRCAVPGSDLPPVQWLSIEEIRLRPDGLIEVTALSGFTCSYRRSEEYLLERQAAALVVTEMRMFGWVSQACRTLFPHLP